MKIQGKGDFSHSETITLEMPGGESITAKLTVPGVDVGEMMLKRLPQPLAPRTVLRDGKRRPVIENGEVLYQTDPRNAGYRELLQEWQVRFGVATFIECLDDETWTFDAKRPKADSPNADWAAYYSAVYDEMAAAHFPAVTFKAMADKVKEISGIDPEEEAHGFLEEKEETENGETDGGSSSKPPKQSESQSPSSSSSPPGSKGDGSDISG